MKLTDSILIFSLLIFGIYGADPELPTVRPPTGLPVADIAKHKTTVAPSTTPTTPKSSTALPTSTTSTSSTTPRSTSTSPPLTSTTLAPPTTTLAPSTTPVAPSTTTAQPHPMPTPSEPEVRNWTLTDHNRTCILVELATQLNISYITNDNKSKYFVYNIPKDSESTVSGSCGNISDTSDQYILIHWSDKNADNTLNMTFKLNHTNEFSLNKVAFNLNNAIFPNDTNGWNYSYYHVGNFFATPKHNAYHCTRAQILNLTNSENSTEAIGTVSFSHTLLEAYHEGKNTQFSTSIDCDAINTPDIVPIAVGIALIALVIIVLIAYVIGRRRSQAHGYVSM